MSRSVQRFLVLLLCTVVAALVLWRLASDAPLPPNPASALMIEAASSHNSESDALVQVGERYFLEQRYAQAAEAYASAATKDPGNQLAFDRLSLALQAQNYIPTVGGYLRTDWRSNANRAISLALITLTLFFLLIPLIRTLLVLVREAYLSWLRNAGPTIVVGSFLNATGEGDKELGQIVAMAMREWLYSANITVYNGQPVEISAPILPLSGSELFSALLTALQLPPRGVLVAGLVRHHTADTYSLDVQVNRRADNIVIQSFTVGPLPKAADGQPTETWISLAQQGIAPVLDHELQRVPTAIAAVAEAIARLGDVARARGVTQYHVDPFAPVPPATQAPGGTVTPLEVARQAALKVPDSLQIKHLINQSIQKLSGPVKS